VKEMAIEAQTTPATPKAKTAATLPLRLSIRLLPPDADKESLYYLALHQFLDAAVLIGQVDYEHETVLSRTLLPP